MITKKQRIRVYTVVEVWRGLADKAKTFVDLEKARRYLRTARRRHNPLEDDVKLFEGTISLSSVERRLRRRSQDFHPISDG